MSVNHTDIYKNSFFGNVLNALGLVKGPIDADMKPLYKILKKYYLRDRNLQKIIDRGKEFVVTVVNVRTGMLQFVSTKEVEQGKIQPETLR